uniref:TNFAIP3-interacting protein 2 n=1 Tax=Paramormyrops kingsleyae TaxID=1676925 RepID=A0A3B3SH81_9TELE|nr:TNFAIP3-interacting protein 2 [Paramormyrops kingsleyae]
MSDRSSVGVDPACHLADPAMENFQVENEVPRTKAQSFNTINTLFHESCREVGVLTHQMRQKDGLITDLRARLARYEGASVRQDGEEPVVFGPSKSLIDTLFEEISMLKQELKDTERQAAQQSETSKLEMERLRQQVTALEQETYRLTRQPEHEKDLEIQRLRRALREQDKAQATRTVLCNSLAEEADQLRSQLGTTVRVCQDLLRRIEGKNEPLGSVDSKTHAPQGIKFTDSAAAQQFTALELKLQKENEVLKQRVAYVESLNAKWQKYDSSREEYVKGLCQKLKELNVGLLQQEIGRLNQLLQQKIEECDRLSRELEESKRADRERIDMLEQQVLTYVDDFKSERADRERAQSRIQDLEEKVRQLEQQLRQQDSLDRSSSCRMPWDSGRTHTSTADSEPLMRSSAERQGTSRQGSGSTQGATRAERPSPTQLQCPHCYTQYDDEHTVEYWRHCDECVHF